MAEWDEYVPPAVTHSAPRRFTLVLSAWMDSRWLSCVRPKRTAPFMPCISEAKQVWEEFPQIVDTEDDFLAAAAKVESRNEPSLATPASESSEGDPKEEQPDVEEHHEYSRSRHRRSRRDGGVDDEHFVAHSVGVPYTPPQPRPVLLLASQVPAPKKRRKRKGEDQLAVSHSSCFTQEESELLLRLSSQLTTDRPELAQGASYSSVRSNRPLDALRMFAKWRDPPRFFAQHQVCPKTIRLREDYRTFEAEMAKRLHFFSRQVGQHRLNLVSVLHTETHRAISTSLVPPSSSASDTEWEMYRSFAQAGWRDDESGVFAPGKRLDPDALAAAGFSAALVRDIREGYSYPLHAAPPVKHLLVPPTRLQTPLLSHVPWPTWTTLAAVTLPHSHGSRRWSSAGALSATSTNSQYLGWGRCGHH
mmetsp:Transcript_18196/g.21803  ORF Transcript_18196/g.21803 Transcript_18196/m.21803 type:complete len:418 (+) Transcript_18196:1392-2645(+)